MSTRDHSNPLQKVMLTQTSRRLERVIGSVCAFIALALSALDVFIGMPAVAGAVTEPALLAALTFLVALTYFFASVAYRLIRGKPNSVGSIASSTIWFTCFGLFVALSLVFIATAIFKRDLFIAQGAALSGLLALLAFGTGSHFRGRR